MSKIKLGSALLFGAVLLVAFAAIIVAGKSRNGEDVTGGDGFIVGVAQQTVVSHAVDSERGIKVILNGEEVIFDVPPQVIDSRVMVPACALAERMGAVVMWNEEMSTLTIINLVDVSPDDRFYRNIMSSIRLGLIDVPRDGRIEPDRYVTIAEFITMLVRLHETWSEPIGTLGVGAYYEQYLAWAVDIGIIRGNEIDDLLPNAQITYERMVVFVYRYLKAFELRLIPPGYAIIGPPLPMMPPESLERIGVSLWAIRAVLYFFETNFFRIPIDTPMNFFPQDNVSRVSATTLLLHVNLRYNLAAQRQNFE